MAVHLLAVLAHRGGCRATSVTLARSVNTNPVIVRRLLLALQRAQLVETCKGAGAGSRLCRSARQISLADIYRAVEQAEPFAAPSRKPDSACPVGHSIGPALGRVFASARGALERDLARTNLAELVASLKR
jgi:DNA-binding IscR family transcriptional regulator